MSKGMQKMALLGLAVVGMAWAGGNKNADTTSSPGSTVSSQGSGAPTSPASGAGQNGSGATQGGTTASSASKGKDAAVQSKQARKARHADIDKARQQALDSLRATFANREAAEMAGSSEIVNEKMRSEAKEKSATK